MYKALSTGAIGLNVSFEEGLALAAKYGFSGLEWNPLEAVKSHGVLGVQDLCAKAGVMPCSFGLPVPVQGESDGYDSALAQLPSIAKAAQDLGIHRCCTYIFSWSDVLPFEQNFEAHVRRIKPCAQILADHGIALGLEFLGPQSLYVGKAHAFIYTLKGMLALCDAIGTGNMGILLDAYHAYAGGMDVADCLGDFADEKQIVLIHINDAPKDQPLSALPDTLRYLPGEGGGIALTPFLNSLQSFGYTGPVIIEPFSETLKKQTCNDAIMKLTADSMNAVWPR